MARGEGEGEVRGDEGEGERGEGRSEGGGCGECVGSLSMSTVSRSLLIPHRSYDTTTENEEMNDDGWTRRDWWREEREACMREGGRGRGGGGRRGSRKGGGYGDVFEVVKSGTVLEAGGRPEGHIPRDDPWHFLSCTKLRGREITARHDDVGRALYRNAMTMGLKAQLEPKGLHTSNRLRPDLLISLPGRRILTDVAVCHPLAPGAVKVGQGTRTLGRAKNVETKKRSKYAQLSSQHHFELLPFAVETSGGLAPSAVQLIQAMALAAAQSLVLWSRTAIVQQLVGSVAIAVQRGTAVSYLEGYDRSLGTMAHSQCRVEVVNDEDDDD